MCCSMENCADCKVSKLRDEEPRFCMHYVYKYPAEAVRIVEEWSKANPVQTNGDKLQEVFKENFPYFISDESTVCIDREWFDQPYEAPKGEDA